MLSNDLIFSGLWLWGCQRSAIVLWPQLDKERHGGVRPGFGPWVVAGLTAKAAAQHAGINDPRIERNDRHPAASLLGNGHGQALNGVFGGTIGGDFGGGAAAPARGKIHHHPAAALEHGWQQVAHDTGGALEVGIHNLAERLGADFPERRIGVDHGGIV